MESKVLGMITAIPAWAMRRAEAEDYGVARDAHRRGTLQIKWPNLKALRAWSKLQGWPTPWFGFEAALLAKLFENQLNFACALNESGIELHIPQREYTLLLERLRELDALYEERSPSGQPAGWGLLVEELREIRRAVEAGVVVQVEGGPRLQTWQGFYEWAHGRYHMLEDGADHWIGDDG
jgi:hypothetical protein